jgi:hypothetical protein
VAGCGTLARDVEECQIQMVAVKPVARWQIWLGKWLGIVTLNAALLAVAGDEHFRIAGMARAGLPPNELAKLNNEVLVARGSVREQSLDKLIDSTTDRAMKSAIKKNQWTGADLNIVRQQLKEQVKAGLPGRGAGRNTLWVIHLGAAKDSLKDQPMFLRVKFNTPQTAPPADELICAWQVGTPQKNADLAKRHDEPGRRHFSSSLKSRRICLTRRATWSFSPAISVKHRCCFRSTKAWKCSTAKAASD